MKRDIFLVVNTNVLFSFFGKSTKTRELIFLLSGMLMSPEFAMEELVKHKDEVLRKAKIRDEDYDGLVRPIDSYRQSLMVNQLNKIVQVGLKMLEKQDLMLQKQDETIRVIREESERTREELKSVIKDESEKTREEIRELRTDLKHYLDERLKKIESEIERIKAKLGMG